MTVSLSGALLTDIVRLTDNTNTNILDKSARTLVTSVHVCPNSGTPTVSLSLYDGTNRRYLWLGRSTVAEGVTYDTPFTIERKWTLQAASGDGSGHLDVAVTYIDGTVGRPGQT